MGNEIPKERRERIREVVEKLSSMDSKSLMSYWIKAEIDEAEAYKELAEKFRGYNWDKRVVFLFEKLAEESLNHAELLMNEYMRKYGGPLVEVEAPPLEGELSRRKLEEAIMNGNLDDILRILMERELLAKEVYEYLASQSTGEEKETLFRLVRMEEGHYNLLRELRDSLT
jgi:rubrerythrin